MGPQQDSRFASRNTLLTAKKEKMMSLLILGELKASPGASMPCVDVQEEKNEISDVSVSDPFSFDMDPDPAL